MLSYPEVPKHLVVIGAGYIGLELGSVWRRLGAKVTVLEAMDRILPGMDQELAGYAQQLFEKQGLSFRLGVRVESATAKQGECTVRCAGSEALPCDRVLLAVGRVANTEGLGLDTVGLQPDRRGEIPVGDNFAASAPGVYAIGDCIRRFLNLRHKASHEAVACVEAMTGRHARVNYETIPGVVYTHPEIASVGKTEQQLQEAGCEYRSGVFPLQASGRVAGTLGETEGRVKVLADAGTYRILGVHLCGPHAGDLIAEAAAAMDFGAIRRGFGSRLPCPSHALGVAWRSGDGRRPASDPYPAQGQTAVSRVGERTGTPVESVLYALESSCLDRRPRAAIPGTFVDSDFDQIFRVDVESSHFGRGGGHLDAGGPVDSVDHQTHDLRDFEIAGVAQRGTEDPGAERVLPGPGQDVGGGLGDPARSETVLHQVLALAAAGAQQQRRAAGRRGR